MPAGWGNLSSDNAVLIRGAVEATLDAHPDWIVEGAEEERKAGRVPDMDKIRENLLTGAIVSIMQGVTDDEGGPVGITRQDEWRAKVSALTEAEVGQAVYELAKRTAYAPAKRADIFMALERCRKADAEQKSGSGEGLANDLSGQTKPMATQNAAGDESGRE